MDYLRITITVSPEGIEAVTARLDRLGITQVSIVDDEREIRKDLEAQARYWDYADVEELLTGHDGPKVQAWLTDDEDGRELARQVCRDMEALRNEDVGLDLGALACFVDQAPDSLWIDEWKKYFRPVSVGNRFCILPTWESVPPEAKGRIALKLHNGNIFGTGQHQTSQLCLELLEDALKPGDRVLDIGCGSGILSIGALLLGADGAVAVDVDGKARVIVPEHLEANAIPLSACRILVGDAVEDRELQREIGTGFDLVLVNIVADVIIRLTPTLQGYLKPGGLALFSGIIEAREGDVVRTLEAFGFTLLRRLTKDDWVGLMARAPTE